MKQLLFILCFACVFANANTKLDFWQVPRKGTNFFNEVETAERFKAAKKEGIEVVRLVFNKWKSTATASKLGDFLIGPKDEYKGLNREDLRKLLHVLDEAEAAGIKIVITNLSLPGLRWVQHNDNVPDHRIWNDFKYHAETENFWKALATALKKHPAVVGYNILNEPHPEKARPDFPDWFLGDYAGWYEGIKGTPRDLNLFHARIANAIRQVDSETPIIIDSGYYATPWAFQVLEPLEDAAVLYSFHMYEPYAFTSYGNQDEKGKQTYFYPGPIPVNEGNPPVVWNWDRQRLSDFLQPVRDWQKRYHIPANRIFVSEFGVFRANAGGADYLSDLIAIFDREQWHWAFYSFREDTWAGMDYELGAQKLPAGQKYPLSVRMKHYQENPLFDALRAGLKAGSH